MLVIRVEAPRPFNPVTLMFQLFLAGVVMLAAHWLASATRIEQTAAAPAQAKDETPAQAKDETCRGCENLLLPADWRAGWASP